MCQSALRAYPCVMIFKCPLWCMVVNTTYMSWVVYRLNLNLLFLAKNIFAPSSGFDHSAAGHFIKWQLVICPKPQWCSRSSWTFFLQFYLKTRYFESNRIGRLWQSSLEFCHNAKSRNEDTTNDVSKHWSSLWRYLLFDNNWTVSCAQGNSPQTLKV